MNQVHKAEMSDGQNLSQSMLRSIDPQGKARDAGNLFGFLLIDGMSCKEELVVASLYRGLEEVQIFGGSAADGHELRPNLRLSRRRVPQRRLRVHAGQDDAALRRVQDPSTSSAAKARWS